MADLLLGQRTQVLQQSLPQGLALETAQPLLQQTALAGEHAQEIGSQLWAAGDPLPGLPARKPEQLAVAQRLDVVRKGRISKGQRRSHDLAAAEAAQLDLTAVRTDLVDGHLAIQHPPEPRRRLPLQRQAAAAGDGAGLAQIAQALQHLGRLDQRQGFLSGFLPS